MRTTINLDSDVARAVDKLRRERSLGLSEAVNELVRSGLASQPARSPFVQRVDDLGAPRMDLTNVAEVLETLEGSTRS